MSSTRGITIGVYGPSSVIDRVRSMLGNPPFVKWTPLTTKSADSVPDCNVALLVLEGQEDEKALVKGMLTAGIPIVSGAIQRQSALVGPTVLSGVTACPYCHDVDHSPHQEGALTPTTMDTLAKRLLAELGAVLGRTGQGASYLNSQLHVQLGIEPKLNQIQRNPTCPVCGSIRSEEDRGRSREFTESLLRAHFDQPKGKHSSRLTYGSPKHGPETRMKVAVVGGGTAGYLTAISLRLRFPHFQVSLVESSRIPIIGVGEATTPLIVHFLFDVLKLDIVEFYALVRPTIKEGIRFDWGLPGDYAFNHPFGLGDVFAAFKQTGHIDNNSLTSLMMVTGRTAVLETGREESPYISLLHRTPHAYHLDNKLFVQYLQKKARELGVEHIDAVIEQDNTVLNPEGDVNSLRTQEGQSIEADFFIDCTGFRSLLMGGVLQSPFESYEDSLLTDRAVVGNAPHHGNIRPYTAADTMQHGWCWGTPLHDSDHHGYVFSSNFCSDDEAIAEMKSKYALTTEPRVVQFTPGRRRDFWKGNVFAVGNSYGFVEPLESTGIHMIIQSILILIAHFPVEPSHTSVRSLLNERMRAHWDFIRWFLAIHYKYNKKLDTPFWKACREDVDISGVQELVDVFMEHGPLSYQPNHIREILLPFQKDIVFGPFGFDVMLLGQGVIPNKNIGLADKGNHWRSKYHISQALLKMAMPQKAALAVLDQYPELLKSGGA